MGHARIEAWAECSARQTTLQTRNEESPSADAKSTTHRFRRKRRRDDTVCTSEARPTRPTKSLREKLMERGASGGGSSFSSFCRWARLRVLPKQQLLTARPSEKLSESHSSRSWPVHQDACLCRRGGGRHAPEKVAVRAITAINTIICLQSSDQCVLTLQWQHSSCRSWQARRHRYSS